MRYAIKIMRDRVEARAVGVAFLRQDLVGPPGLRADGKRRRAVTSHRLPADILQHLFGSPDIGAELIRRLPIDPLVGVSVAGKFVSGRRDSSHEAGMALGNPAQSEKGR